MDLRGLETYGYTYAYYGDSTELVYLRARMYASGMGRFITRDTWGGDINSPMSYNRWNYVQANPINNIDPTGHVSIHSQVIIRYAFRDNLAPEYTISSTIPSKPPLWPGQRRGKHVDLADTIAHEIWEVEEYSASGNYPQGHGPGQVDIYLDLLNIDSEYQWTPGRFLRPLSFSNGAYDVNAWSEQPGLIVYKTRLNKERVLVTTTTLCLVGLTRLIQQLRQTQQRVRDFPGQWPPLPGAPVSPIIPIFPPPIIPVPIFIP